VTVAMYYRWRYELKTDIACAIGGASRNLGAQVKDFERRPVSLLEKSQQI